ncbi:MAG: hypothetical protein ACK4QW_19375, partial [Alphaproteobacteria bacterium]
MTAAGVTTALTWRHAAQDNADRRLTRLGAQVGCVSEQRLRALDRKEEQIERGLACLHGFKVRRRADTAADTVAAAAAFAADADNAAADNAASQLSTHQWQQHG